MNKEENDEVDAIQNQLQEEFRKILNPKIQEPGLDQSTSRFGSNMRSGSNLKISNAPMRKSSSNFDVPAKRGLTTSDMKLTTPFDFKMQNNKNKVMPKKITKKVI